MPGQHGFTLIELMIVIAIIAILSAIGLPAYQSYLQKAALTDMLQTIMPLKTAVEICAIEQGDTANCSAGNAGITEATSSRYISNTSIQAGTITLNGREMLQGLTISLAASWDNEKAILRWKRRCDTSQNSLKSACESVFLFDDGDAL